ncbi:uncharacterized protein PODANS_1_8830 [Podospora anserina S mat+]|uniref:Podospora anserina S mat+ genomic DNA chromosome 1, supercontig 2 n=1 Tax=Podospora anserina (strain S / ATCC MYA-4624 / DSM 980 / FGSC 10383) TaxID=515849 RepID=B2AXU1_PODAN|nr:uncharacterized protein PODANS_1_8830 [Podospora anserina S mat+]CAP69215.1 unnamed protein product [Podospora anserina S mat+]CDP23237.1 Putative protein of unknown function [Podospora anserina S mat+]
MPRQQILRAGVLGRRAPPSTTTTSAATRSFTTSGPQLAEEDNNNKPTRSISAATRLTKISTGAAVKRPLDIRTLRANNTGPSASPFGKAPSASGAPTGAKILSIKSLRLAARYTPGGGAGTVGPRPSTGFRSNQQQQQQQTGFRRAGPGAGGRQSGNRPARLSGKFTRGAGGKGGNKQAKKEKPKEANEGKMVLSEAEKAVVDRYEKGEVVPFVPKLRRKDLSGYGGGLATSAQWGKVQSVIQTMRLMGGGQAFNRDSGVTMDITAVRKRAFKEGKPIFFNSQGERDWLEKGERFFPGRAPLKAREAVLDLAVLGNYKEVGYKELGDVKGLIENYTARTWSYRGEDQRRFLDKVMSLLPAEAAKGKGGAQKRA